jgi:hypothetical protein
MLVVISVPTRFKINLHFINNADINKRVKFMARIVSTNNGHRSIGLYILEVSIVETMFRGGIKGIRILF